MQNTVAPPTRRKKLLTPKNMLILEIVGVAAVFVVGLLLRLQSALTVEYTLMTDALNYHNMALRLVAGGPFGYLSESADAYVTPLYPLFLAGIYKLAGPEHGILAAQLVQCVLGSLTAVIGYLIGRRFFNRPVGFITAVCLAMYPPFVMGSMCLLTECLYVFLFLIYFYFQLASLAAGPSVPLRRRLVLAGLSGLFFTLAVLTRPGIFPLLLLPYLYKGIRDRRDRAGRRAILLEFLTFAAVIVLCMLPWWIRNLAVLGQFVLLCTQGGNPLLFGTFPDMQIPADFTCDPADQTKIAIERIITGFTTEPSTYLKWYTVGKFRLIFFNIWYYLPGPVSMPYLYSYLYIMHYSAVVLGWFGTIWGLFRRNLRFVSVYAILLTAMQLLFIPTERYAYTILPLLMLAGASVIYECFHLCRRPAEQP